MSNHAEDHIVDLPPAAVLMPMLFGGLIQQCIRTVAKLGIADLLAQHPQTADELAAQTGAHGPSLHRVLRTLAGAGVFVNTGNHAFALTPVGDLLRSDVPDSMHDFAILQGEEWNWRGIVELPHTVMTGEPAHIKAHGMALFEFLAQHPEDAALFDRAMTSYSSAAIPTVVQACDLTNVGTLVDVGGGHGSLLVGFLTAYPHLRGVLFDLPFVIDGANGLLVAAGVRDRVEPVVGDFFDSVPSDGDVYVMKNILHDWDDDHCVKILSNVRAAMSDTAKLLIVELLVTEDNQPSPAKLVDAQMLVTTGGRERTQAEFEQLLIASKLRLRRVTPTRSPMYVVEAVPA